ncbi:type II secretion system minor pseudopilin GspJ [Microbulbifer guangxiensis]|uniref:type II secretion system minor pseudopilin GspJ n=1 Tax=Microbulbifer guangxiensis TaxID=2904249 RepID=UPI001F028078
MRRYRGFTLIEMMVVLTIVAVISIGSYALMDTLNGTDRMLSERAEEMRRMSMAMYRIEDDLRQLTARPVKNPYSGYEPALRGDVDELEFTRLGAANLTGEPRGELQRLSYSLGFAEQGAGFEEGGGLLLRSRWRVLDRAPDTEPVSEPLLLGIQTLGFRYYDADSKVWLAEWPPLDSRGPVDAVEIRLPDAVELTMETSVGEIRRVFPLNRYEMLGATGADGGDDNTGPSPDPGDSLQDDAGQDDGAGGSDSEQSGGQR